MLEILPQFIVNALMLSLTYALVAVGLSLVFGIMRITNFAHGELYMLGAVIVYLTYGLGYVPYAVAVVIAMLGVAAVSMLLYIALFRRLTGQPIPAFVMSVGITFILQVSVLVTVGGKIKNIPTAFPGVVTLGSSAIAWQRIVVIVTAIVLMVLLHVFINRTNVGRAIQATSQSPVGAALQGINPHRMALLVMVLAGLLAGAAGGLIGSLTGVTPYMGVPIIVKTFLIVIVGGMGSYLGTIIAAFIFGFAEALMSTFVDPSAAALTGFLLMASILVVRPQGLLGRDATGGWE